ncbi:MAG: duplicated hybrid motif [Verrucomicrobiaceae bacterium]|nr:duplicated hybrid motif [Verrucomicrobiaceae bacterium]
MRRQLKTAEIVGLLALLAAVVISLWPAPTTVQPSPFDPAFSRLSALEIATLPIAVRWDAPMGSELGALTYNAQPFRVTRHLGDDLNGIGGYNSDLGDSVYAAAAGRVVFAGVPGTGWGNMVILSHRVFNAQTGELDVVQSMYAHLEKILVQPGQTLHRGEKLGTVGTGGGLYLAHLHFETRHGPYINPSVGYADAPLNRMSPEHFVAEHRGAAVTLLNPAPH